MVLIDAISRLQPGVLGDPESLTQDTFSGRNPAVTRSTRGPHGTGT